MVPSLRSLSCLLVAGFLLTGCGVPVTQVASGFGFADIQTNVRPPLTEDGRVGILRGTRVDVSNGVTTTSVDLGPYGLSAFQFGKPVQIANSGDVVFGARSSPRGCAGDQHGVYRMNLAGGAPVPLWEACVTAGSSPALQPYLSLTPNGTLAFSMIRSGTGAILRGPVAGPLAELRTGTGEFFNTLDLAANDAGQVAMNMEYFDGIAGGLMRGVPVFSTPGQTKAATPFAIEKQSIGALNTVAINASGTMAVVLPANVTLSFGPTVQTFTAGVYRATPTLWNTPKNLTQVFARGTGYCRIGNVDINDVGTIVFEVAYEQSSCGIADTYDALIARAANGTTTVIAIRGEDKFGDHQFFDSIRLGEINNAGQISFLTTYSEPLVDPVKVWRAY